jgi:DHA1 family bicyclomycin/chloramphenicol resistance-like MFS transporter
MYVPALPAIARDLEVSTALTQLTLTTFLIGLAAGQLVSGPLSDALGRRRPLLAGAAVYAGASAACALAPSVHILAGARFAQGLAAAAGVVISRAVIRDLYSGAALARAYSRLYVVVGAAPIVAPVLGTQILRFTSWRGIFVTLAALALVLIAVGLFRLPETLRVERRTAAGFRATATTFRVALRHRGLVGYALTLGCAAAALLSALAGAPFVVQEAYGESPQAYGFVLLVGGLVVVGTTQLNSVLLRELPPERLLAFGCFVAATAGLAMIAFGGRSVWAFVVCFVGVFASYGFVAANATALALREQAAVAGAAAALLGLVQFGTGGVAAPLTGLAGADRVAPLGIVISTLALGGLVSLIVTMRGERRRREGEAAAVRTASHSPGSRPS